MQKVASGVLGEAAVEEGAEAVRDWLWRLVCSLTWHGDGILWGLRISDDRMVKVCCRYCGKRWREPKERLWN